MDRDRLRNRFLANVDRETFRKFSLQLRRDSESNSTRRIGRLRHWQAAIWDQFKLDNSEVLIPSDVESIRTSLLWCDVHAKYLLAGTAVPDRVGVTDRDGKRLSDEFAQSLDERFPFGFGYWKLICTDCVIECDAWMKARETANP